MPNVLVIIPARGGSKGIPRKNIRDLAGRPLLYYSIQLSLKSCHQPDVYVTSDDAEILSVARKLGAKTIERDGGIADDATTLDPVIYDAYKKVEKIESKSYDLIVTLQPTSPLLKTASLDDGINVMLAKGDVETIIAAVEDTHLTWRSESGQFLPNYVERVNRQCLEPNYKETGGFIITRPKCVSVSNRIGRNVQLYLLGKDESVDIDTYEDWSLCEYYLKRKKVLFVVSGHKFIGLGHVYNALLLANDILSHQVEFLVDRDSRLAFDKIASKNYRVNMQCNDDITEDIKRLCPDIVINDRLDTEVEYIRELKAQKIKVINFEDLGEGALEADLVINAIYPEKQELLNHYFGHNYFLLRDEFLLTKPKDIEKKVKKVLLTFGGVDPGNFTKKVACAIEDYCQKNEVQVSIVTGFGYDQYESLEELNGVTTYRNSQSISEHMQNADIIFTSAGRTAYEVASLNIPTIVLAQNARELTHLFASEQHGFVNLGLGFNVSPEKISEEFKELANDYQRRKAMSELMAKTDLFNGRKRTIKLINELVERT